MAETFPQFDLLYGLSNDGDVLGSSGYVSGSWGETERGEEGEQVRGERESRASVPLSTEGGTRRHGGIVLVRWRRCRARAARSLQRLQVEDAVFTENPLAQNKVITFLIQQALGILIEALKHFIKF